VAWAGTKLFLVLGMLFAVAAAAVAFVSISTTTLFTKSSLSYQSPVANIVNFGFFRFPYHFSSSWPCESST
jgi:hypothetical protein